MTARSDFLGKESIKKLLLSFSLPAFIGMFISGIYNIIDTIFISKGIGTLAVGGVGIVYPIQTLYTAFSQMISIGTASAISRSLGEKNEERAHQITTNAYVLTTLISIILMVLTYFFINPILYLFGVNQDLFPFAKEYLQMSIWTIPFNALALISSAVFRAEGKIKVSMIIVLIGSVLNIVFDPLFIFILNLGIKGAALATTVAQCLATICSIIFILRHKSTVQFKRKYLIPNFDITKLIISVGFSAFARNASSSLFALITNTTLRTYGNTISLTAFGTVNRVISFFFLPIMGINQGMQPIASYNYGAKQPQRIKEVVKLSLILTTLIGLIATVTGILCPYRTVNIFLKDKTVLEEASFVLKLQLFFFWTIGLQTVTSTLFQSLGQALPSLFLSILRQFIILTPLILILPRFTPLGIHGVWYAFPISDFVSFVIIALILKNKWSKLDINISH